MSFKNPQQQKEFFSTHSTMPRQFLKAATDQPQVPFHSHLAAYFDGGVIPGKAEVSGDSEKNDKVMIKASPGEVVLPRSVSKAPDAPEKAKRFMKLIEYCNGGMVK